VQEKLHAVELVAEPADILACGQEATALVGYSMRKRGCYAMDQGSKDGFRHGENTFGTGKDVTLTQAVFSWKNLGEKLL
jgi:hypothetical protein